MIVLLLMQRKEQLKKKMKKERKMQRLQKQAEGGAPAKRKREPAGPPSLSTQSLHPSWAAKKQQKVTIDQTAPSKAKKVVFDE